MTAYNLDPGAAVQRKYTQALTELVQQKKSKRKRIMLQAQALERKAYLQKIKRLQEAQPQDESVA